MEDSGRQVEREWNGLNGMGSIHAIKRDAINCSSVDTQNRFREAHYFFIRSLVKHRAAWLLGSHMFGIVIIGSDVDNFFVPIRPISY